MKHVLDLGFPCLYRHIGLADMEARTPLTFTSIYDNDQSDFQPIYVFLVQIIYPVVCHHLYPVYLYLQDTCGDILTVLQLYSIVITHRGILGIIMGWGINHQ